MLTIVTGLLFSKGLTPVHTAKQTCTAGEVLECNIIRCHAETLSSSHRRAHIDVSMRLRSVAKKLALRQPE